MAGFFKPEEEAIAAKKAYEEGTGEIKYLNFMPRNFEEGAAFYYTSRGNTERYSNLAVMWSQLDLIKYNVPEAFAYITPFFKKNLGTAED